MTEVSPTSSSVDPSKSDDPAVRKPGKLGNMVNMFEKKAEEKQQPPPTQTRSASNSITSPTSHTSSITSIQHSASTSSTSSPAAPRVGASIADRMAAMKNLTMQAPPPQAAPPHAAPGKLSAAAKTLPLSFDPSSAAAGPTASSVAGMGNPGPRPNKLALGGLGGALNAALANGLRAGMVPGGARSPSGSVVRRADGDGKAAADEVKEKVGVSGGGGGEAAVGGAAELTHAKRAKRAGRSKAVSRPGAGTLQFKAFNEVSRAADTKAAVTIVTGEEKKDKEMDAVQVSDKVATAPSEQPAVLQAAVQSATATRTLTTQSVPTTPTVAPSASAIVPTIDNKALPASAAQIAPVTIVSAPASPATKPSTDLPLPATIVPAAAVTTVPAITTTAAVTTAPIILAAVVEAQTKPAAAQTTSTELKAAAPAPSAAAAPNYAATAPSLNTSSATIDSIDDSLNNSFSSVASSSSATSSLDSSFTGEQLSVYNAAADYFSDPATLGYNPALHASYSTRLHTGATFHRWQLTGSSAKRLLYLSDCATFLCLVDAKKRLPLDKVEAKRRLPVAALAEAVKGKVAGDAVWARPACKEVLGGRCLVVRCGGGGAAGEAGMLGEMHLEALTGVQRDEWEEALRWLIATKGKEKSNTAG